MPRPGPRPYECIRRAWHSDSHQPLRGALIQEIFRVVNELHSTTTRRKKEWQEKLPIVVLRAEEILYSKANSEGEYAGVETLKTRLEDAVNTMIRREDSEEDGAYLIPCVEAALSLGCTPKKIPRGQRQGASRLLPNTTKRSSPISANTASFRPVIGKCIGEASNADCIPTPAGGAVHDKGSSSTFSLLGVQTLPMQDRGTNSALHMTTSSMFSPIGAPSGTSACYTSNVSLIAPQNFSFHNPHEVSHSVVTPSLPELGGLVQFLKAADAGRHARFPASETLQVSSQMQFNVNPESRALQFVDSMNSSGARMDTRFVRRDSGGSLGTATAVTSPASTVSRLSPEVGRELYTESDQPGRRSFGGVGAAGIDSVTCSAAQNCLPFPMDTGLIAQMQVHSNLSDNGHTCPVPKVGMPPFLPNCYRSDETSALQFNTLTALSATDTNPVSHTSVHDLQLRLGPPGKEPTSTSGQLPFSLLNCTEDASTSSWNDVRSLDWNNPSVTLSGGKKLGLFANSGCEVLPVLTVDASTAKRMRVDMPKRDVSVSSGGEQFLQYCELPPSRQFTWS